MPRAYPEFFSRGGDAKIAIGFVLALNTVYAPPGKGADLPFDTASLSARGFVAPMPGPRDLPDYLSMRNQGDRSRASIMLVRSTFSDIRDRIKDPTPNSSLSWRWGSNGGFTNLPAGEYALHIGSGDNDSSGGGLSLFHAFADTYAIYATLSYSDTGKPGSIVWSGKDRDGDREALEGTVRSALATALGSHLADGGTGRVNGQDIGCKKLPSGTKFVKVDDWVRAYGASLTVNAVRCTASFTYGGKQYILPLSANQVKAGSEWVNLGDFIRQVGRLWYVPLDAMEQAIR